LTTEQLLANGVSPASLEVIDHFGPDAPAVLNDYACKVEDALITTNKQTHEAAGLLQELNNEHKAYEKILTNPDVLADYTTKFFGPNGPYPLAANKPAAPAPVAAPTGQFPSAPPSRPEMPVPPAPEVQQGNPTEFWNNFGSAADRDPQNAWKYLSAAQQNPEIFRQKLLVME